MDELTLIQRLAVLALPMIFAITVHEAAHGYVASRLGDQTARLMGRITVNPLPHIDLIGTILVPAVMALLVGFPIGWAKPVPVDPRNLHDPKRDSAIVAAAGPLSNLVMAVLWVLILLGAQQALHSVHSIAYPLMLMAVAGIYVNLLLMVLNLLPIPPLDGGRILVGLLPMPIARLVARIEPYGMFVLIGLLISGILGLILGPVLYAAVVIMPGSDTVLGILPLLLPS